MIIRSDDRAKILSGMKVGYLIFEMVTVEKSNEVTEKIVASAIENTRERFPSLESVSEDPVIKGVRRLFSVCGMDPTKERPSGEALIRRVVGGKGIYQVNTAVDANNSVSMMSGYPCGIYDLDMIRGEVVVSVGIRGERYEGIHKRVFSAEDRIVTRDEISIFGAPTADSGRTSVNLGTKNLLMLIYHYQAPEKCLSEAMDNAKKAIGQATGSKCMGSEIFEVG